MFVKLKQKFKHKKRSDNNNHNGKDLVQKYCKHRCKFEYKSWSNCEQIKNRPKKTNTRVKKQHNYNNRPTE